MRLRQKVHATPWLFVASCVVTTACGVDDRGRLAPRNPLARDIADVVVATLESRSWAPGTRVDAVERLSAHARVPAPVGRVVLEHILCDLLLRTPDGEVDACLHLEDERLVAISAGASHTSWSREAADVPPELRALCERLIDRVVAGPPLVDEEGELRVFLTRWRSGRAWRPDAATQALRGRAPPVQVWVTYIVTLRDASGARFVVTGVLAGRTLRVTVNAEHEDPSTFTPGC
jgi:hypothetical protein